MTTATRSFGLDEKLLQRLSASARKYGVTENELVSSWLSWRIGFDPLLPTFDGVMLAGATLKSILATCDTGALEILASELGKKHFTTSMTLFEAVEERLTFVKFVDDILGKRGRWFRVEGAIGETSDELLLQHRFTIKWSAFLKGYLSGAYEAFSHKRLNVEIKDTFIRLKLNRPEE